MWTSVSACSCKNKHACSEHSMYWNHTLGPNVFLLAAICLYIRARRFGQDERTVQEPANLHSKHCGGEHFIVRRTFLYYLHHYIWLHIVILRGYTARYCYCCWQYLCQKYAVLKSQTHGSLKCLGLKYSPNCICYIMSCLNIAQQQGELIYLWQPRRGQYFFHTFEKSLGGRKWTSRNCCIICTWVGIVSVCELVLQV